MTEYFIDKRAAHLLDRGRIAVERGDFLTALHEFKASAHVRPSAAALNNWGSMEHCLGDVSRAMELCREAIALEPDWGPPYNNIGSYLVALRRDEEAIAWFQRAAACPRCDGQGHVPHINLGKLYLARNDWERAKEHTETALAMDPNNGEALALASEVRRRGVKAERRL